MMDPTCSLLLTMDSATSDTCGLLDCLAPMVGRTRSAVLLSDSTSLRFSMAVGCIFPEGHAPRRPGRRGSQAERAGSAKCGAKSSRK